MTPPQMRTHYFYDVVHLLSGEHREGSEHIATGTRLMQQVSVLLEYLVVDCAICKAPTRHQYVEHIFRYVVWKTARRLFSR